MAFPNWEHGNFTFTGSSIAGTFTSLHVRELDLCFDVGNGPFSFHSAKHFFLTHGHADHASGLPYLLSMKALTRQQQAQVYLPEALAPQMEKVLALWQEIEGHAYNYRLHPARENSVFPLKGNYSVKPFPTVHRVASCGYTVFETKRKLKEEFIGKSREEILQAKDAGVDIHSHEENPAISFTGDTQIEVLDRCPWLLQSKILFIEVSFIDQKRTVEEARHWGHIHWEEIRPRLDEFQGEKLVFIHLSQRYSTQEFEALLTKTLPLELREKIIVFPRNG